jgi:hypothetical protein
MQLSDELPGKWGCLPYRFVDELSGLLMVPNHLYQRLRVLVGGASIDQVGQDAIFDQGFSYSAVDLVQSFDYAGLNSPTPPKSFQKTAVNVWA